MFWASRSVEVSVTPRVRAWPCSAVVDSPIARRIPSASSPRRAAFFSRSSASTPRSSVRRRERGRGRRASRASRVLLRRGYVFVCITPFHVKSSPRSPRASLRRPETAGRVVTVQLCRHQFKSFRHIPPRRASPASSRDARRRARCAVRGVRSSWRTRTRTTRWRGARGRSTRAIRTA